MFGLSWIGIQEGRKELGMFLAPRLSDYFVFWCELHILVNRALLVFLIALNNSTEMIGLG